MQPALSIVARQFLGSAPPIWASAAFLLLTLSAPAPAQVGRQSVPDADYFGGLRDLYDGQYRDASRTMVRQQRGSVKLPQRWIDSICFHAANGEALYQAGAMREALAEFNRACELHLAYPQWMLRVQFQQPPRADANPRRLAPWGRPRRRVTYARLPQTMLISYGQINNNQIAEQGGVVRQAQFWRLNVAEVVRSTALAIRRRNALLGPLGPHDALSRQLADTLVRSSPAPPNHWSAAWGDLLTGLAQLGVGKPREAAPYLVKAELLDGQFDHALTGAALLAQAQLALATGDLKPAPRLAREAALAAYAYEDWDVLCESLALAHVVHLATGRTDIDPELPTVAAWAERERAEHIATLTKLLLAEQTALARDNATAANLVANAVPRRGEVKTGRLAPFADYVGALIAYQAGDRTAGDQTIRQALARYSQLAFTNFQLALANERYDAGELPARVAVGVYETLLTDPGVGHWALDPMDALAALLTDHDAAFNRWITATIARKETLQAFYAADLAKRRRFFNRQQLGGRLLALRMLLEGPEAQLSKAQRLTRQAFDARLPAYRAVAEQSDELRRQLVAEKALLSEESRRQDLVRLEQMGDLAARRETMLRELALHRLPADLGFPPRRGGEDLQAKMQDGDALLAFHQLGDSLHGFVIAKSGQHYWRLPDVAPLTGKIADLLRELGNYSSTKVTDPDTLASEQWRSLALQLSDAILGESRLDVRQTKRLVIVPDGPLWHLPFEILVVGEPDSRTLLADAVQPRYTPTAGLAWGAASPFRPLRYTGLAMGDAPSGDDEQEMQAMALKGLERAIENPAVLPAPSPVASPLLASTLDALVSHAGESLEPRAPYDWSPLPIDRNAAAGRLGAWTLLPRQRPQRMMLVGVHTAAENALKGASRRGARRGESASLGQEVFHAACSLMAAGTQTVVLSRWQTGGATHRKLVQEMAIEWTRTPAAEAWARSVSLARAGRLDPYQEPRFRPRGVDDAPPSADHPFYWAGYLLLDVGRPLPPEERLLPPQE